MTRKRQRKRQSAREEYDVQRMNEILQNVQTVTSDSASHEETGTFYDAEKTAEKTECARGIRCTGEGVWRGREPECSQKRDRSEGMLVIATCM